MKALVLDAANRTGIVQDIPRPTPAPNELLIRVQAIALNPVDALYTAHPLGQSGRLIGSDFAGTVLERGSAVPAPSNLQVESRVAGFLQRACSVNDRSGAFAEFQSVPADMRFEDSASVSLCALTAAQALFVSLGTPAPFPVPSTLLERPRDGSLIPKTVFINGATTLVGLHEAQLVRKVSPSIILIGSASPKHFAVLREPPYLYDDVVDYRSPNWPQKVRAATENCEGVDAAFDCISEGSSVLKTNATLNTSTSCNSNARMAVVRSRAGAAWDASLEHEPSYGAVWEGLGETVEYAGMSLPANAEMRAFTEEFYRWLSRGGIVPNRVRITPGGLDSVVVDGFRLLGTGSMEDRRAGEEAEWMRPVSAEKLVYKIG